MIFFSKICISQSGASTEISVITSHHSCIDDNLTISILFHSKLSPATKVSFEERVNSINRREAFSLIDRNSVGLDVTGEHSHFVFQFVSFSHSSSQFLT